MKRFERIAVGLPVAPVLAAIKPEMWDQITTRQDYAGSAHHSTRTIFLRGPADGANVFDGLESVSYPLAEDMALRGAVEEAIFGAGLDLCEMGRIMLVELKPGAHIDRHADEGAYARHFSRFHIPLVSDPAVQFWCGHESVHMAAGECWWFEHQLEHEVRNGSDMPRIHLIFDARVSGLYRSAAWE